MALGCLPHKWEDSPEADAKSNPGHGETPTSATACFQSEPQLVFCQTLGIFWYNIITLGLFSLFMFVLKIWTVLENLASGWKGHSFSVSSSMADSESTGHDSPCNSFDSDVSIGWRPPWWPANCFSPVLSCSHKALEGWRLTGIST